MEIQEAKPEDIKILAGFLTKLFQQDLEFKPKISRQEKGLQDIINNPLAGKILIIKENNEIFGMLNILFTISTALGGKAAVYKDMYIREDKRRLGLGTELINAGIQYLKKNGFLRITILTDYNNKAAISLYEKTGFTKSKMIPLRMIF